MFNQTGATLDNFYGGLMGFVKRPSWFVVPEIHTSWAGPYQYIGEKNIDIGIAKHGGQNQEN